MRCACKLCGESPSAFLVKALICCSFASSARHKYPRACEQVTSCNRKLLRLQKMETHVWQTSAAIWKIIEIRCRSNFCEWVFKCQCGICKGLGSYVLVSEWTSANQVLHPQKSRLNGSFWTCERKLAWCAWSIWHDMTIWYCRRKLQLTCAFVSNISYLRHADDKHDKASNLPAQELHLPVLV